MDHIGQDQDPAERFQTTRWGLVLPARRQRDGGPRGSGRPLRCLAGKSRAFEALRLPLLGGAERVPYAPIAAALGISEEAARAAAHRLRSRYREILREEVARTLDDPSEVAAEIRALFAALRG